MLKTKSPSNDQHDVIIQNGHTDILDEEVETSSEIPGESTNQELVVNGTSIVQQKSSTSNFGGAKPKLKQQQSESVALLPQISTSSSTSSQNNSSSINHVTDTFSELSVKSSDCENKNSSSTSSDEKIIAGHHQEVEYIVYENELQMPCIMRLIQKDLSEPYSIYTYRYFIHNWPHLCFMAHVSGECVGAIVCKLDYHKKIVKRGYIAMLAVDSGHRKRKIGSTLVKRAIDAMIAEDADEVVLETEITNKPALRLYENLGFVRDKRLFRYYLNGVDALRLKLWLR